MVATSVALAMVTAACSSTVQGQGAGPVAPSSSTAAVSVTSGPSDSESNSDSGAPSSSDATTSAAPVAQPPPPQCPGAACPELATAALGNGFVAILRNGQASDGSVGASVLELTENGVAVDWHGVNGETPAHLTCLPGAAAHCVVVDYAGAHGASASVWRLGLDSATFAKTATVAADTPTMSARDLNHDGFLDVLGLQNDYTHDYATGKVQWQTWLFDGKTLSSTGCTALATAPPPRPTAPATAPCSAI
jgi:hypothetical protein